MEPPEATYPRHIRHVEQSIHKRVCAYLRKEYPGVMFRTDGGGLHLSKTQAIEFRRVQWPDLFIPACKRGFHGLFLELKQEGTSIYKKIGQDKGQLVADKHIREQAEVLNQLNKTGYFARFAIGEEKAKQIIDWYMERPQNAELF